MQNHTVLGWYSRLGVNCSAKIGRRTPAHGVGADAGAAAVVAADAAAELRVPMWHGGRAQCCQLSWHQCRPQEPHAGVELT